MPAYVRYSIKCRLDPVSSGIYRSALDTIWRALLGEEQSSEAIKAMEAECLNSIPSEDDWLRVGEPYSEDAGAAAVFAIRTLLTCDPNVAIWAAQRVIDAVDDFVARVENQKSDLGSSMLSSQALIEKELAFQVWIVKQLEDSLDSVNWKAALNKLRERAQDHTSSVFEIDMNE